MITLWLIGFYLTKKICDYTFPDEMTQIYLKTSIFGLRCVSSLCVVCVKVYNGYRAFLMDHKKEEDTMILCISNGKVLHTLTGSDIQLLPDFFEKYDLVLYKERLQLNDICNYKYQITRLDKGSSLANGSSSANLPPPSTIHFVDITVNTNGQKYTLDFGNSNFYIEGNILCDKVFLQWYLNAFLKIDLVEPYTYTIMDADINFITLDANSHIVIQKDTYTVASANTRPS